MKQLTIRNVSQEIALALEKEKKRSGRSLNQTTLDLLRQALGVSIAHYNNGLGKLAGTWSHKDLATFKKNTKLFEHVDRELWK